MTAHRTIAKYAPRGCSTSSTRSTASGTTSTPASPRDQRFARQVYSAGHQRERGRSARTPAGKSCPRWHQEMAPSRSRQQQDRRSLPPEGAQSALGAALRANDSASVRSPVTGARRTSPVSGDGVRRVPGGLVLAGLALLLVALVVFAIGYGAFHIPAADVVRILAANVGLDPGTVDSRQVAVLNSIRLPRVILAIVTGAGLAVAGALMQGLFRNPLADPDADRRVLGRRAGGRLRHRARGHAGSPACRSRSARGRCRSPPSSARCWSPWPCIASAPQAAFSRCPRCCSPASRSMRWRWRAWDCCRTSPATSSFATSRSGTSARSAAPTWDDAGRRRAAGASPRRVAGILLARPLNALALGEAQAAHIGVNVVAGQAHGHRAHRARGGLAGGGHRRHRLHRARGAARDPPCMRARSSHRVAGRRRCWARCCW